MSSDDQRELIQVSASVCMGLALISSAMRLASRRVKRVKLIVSDYLEISGLLCACTVSSIIIAGVSRILYCIRGLTKVLGSEQRRPWA